MRYSLEIHQDHAAAPPARDTVLKGLVTAADLPQAEREWPGLQAFFAAIPSNDLPRTFLDLVWRFEQHRCVDQGQALAA